MECDFGTVTVTISVAAPSALGRGFRVFMGSLNKFKAFGCGVQPELFWNAFFTELCAYK